MLQFFFEGWVSLVMIYESRQNLQFEQRLILLERSIVRCAEKRETFQKELYFTVFTRLRLRDFYFVRNQGNRRECSCNLKGHSKG